MKIIVIGGGATGLSCAFFLARSGERDVTLLESSPVLGFGSSGRNPGAIRSGFGAPFRFARGETIVESFQI